MTPLEVLRDLAGNPRRLLIEKWNWKSAFFSSTIRAALFLCTTLTAGWRAATGAMLAEFLYRGLSSGFCGAVTQAFSGAEPAWAAAGTTAILLPAATQAIESVMHVVLRTPNIRAGLIASILFTAISTLFNLYAMRRGTLLVGSESGSIGADLRHVPALIGGFILAGPLALFRSIRNTLQPVRGLAEREQGVVVPDTLAILQEIADENIAGD